MWKVIKTCLASNLHKCGLFSYTISLEIAAWNATDVAETLLSGLNDSLMYKNTSNYMLWNVWRDPRPIIGGLLCNRGTLSLYLRFDHQGKKRTAFVFGNYRFSDIITISAQQKTSARWLINSLKRNCTCFVMLPFCRHPLRAVRVHQLFSYTIPFVDL